MKKLVFVIVVIVLGAFFLRTNEKPVNTTTLRKVEPTKTQTQPSLSTSSSSLFIPYWSLGTTSISTDGYNELIYFGIAANGNGVDRTDPGYKNIPQFFQLTNSQTKKLLAVRLINPDVNSLILKNKTVQNKIIQDSVGLAKYNGFDGIVLDFEVSALAFDNIIQSISTFEEDFDTQAKQKNLVFKTMVFGDSIYRLRPYDIQTIAKHSDQVMVMAYDFHKANGDPGPNFPLSGKDTYGYDFETMLTNFKSVVPQNKLSIVFGLFGYDWNEQNDQPATSLSLNQIHTKFFPNCLEKNCTIRRDQQAGETTISYVDTSNQKHVVWFEDMESVKEKQKVLQHAGITNTAMWAYSYF